MTLPCLRLVFPGEIAMEMKTDTAELCVQPNIAVANLDEATELNLYDELVAFSELSFEQQLVDVKQSAERNGYEKQSNELACAEIGAVTGVVFDSEEATPMKAINPKEIKPSAPPSFAELETVDFFDELIFDTAQTEIRDHRPALAEDKTIESRQTPRTLSNTSPLDDLWSGARVKTGPLIMCQSCGNHSDAEDLLCIGCGEFFEHAEAGPNIAMNCSECDALIGNDDMFCSSCGAMLTA
jgi:hypothetical protein